MTMLEQQADILTPQGLFLSGTSGRTPVLLDSGCFSG
jgi:hypothetical protein